MSISVQRVQGILQGGGTIAFNNNNLKPTSCSAVPKVPERFGVYDNYRMAHATIGENVINMRACKDNDRTANAIKIEYDDCYACCGGIWAPSIIYSDSFSGCEFFIYRGPMNYIHGVHASRSSGILADPSDYFLKRGGTLLYRWNSKGAMSDKQLMAGCFGAVLAVINRDQIDVFALAMKGRQVHSIIGASIRCHWCNAGNCLIAIVDVMQGVQYLPC